MSVRLMCEVFTLYKKINERWSQACDITGQADFTNSLFSMYTPVLIPLQKVLTPRG